MRWRSQVRAGRTALLVLLVGSITLIVAAVERARARALTGAAQSVLAEQPPRVVEELFEEKVVLLTGGQGPYVEALVIFQQPRRRALRLLAQTGRHAEFRPELERVETIRSGKSESVDAHRMKVVFKTIDYHLRSHFDWKNSRISWELDPGYDNGVRALEGYWEMHELDAKRTLALFGSRVDVGPALPLWLQEAATRKNVPEAVERVRRWVDSNGSYRP